MGRNGKGREKGKEGGNGQETGRGWRKGKEENREIISRLKSWVYAMNNEVGMQSADG